MTGRRTPVQQRSKERVERILEAARERLAEVGDDRLTMTDIAATAGVPIGSVYSYFPDKAAILRALALRFMAAVNEGLAAALPDVRTREAALAGVEQLVAEYYGLFRGRSDIRELWIATQSDQELQALDIEDSRANGAVLAAAIEHLARPGTRERLRTTCFVVMHLTGHAVRLAIAVDPDEGDRIMDEHAAMLRQALAPLLDA